MRIDMESLWSRRGLFVVGGQIIAGTTLAAALERHAQAQPADAVDWKHLFSAKPEGGTGVVKQLKGVAFAGKRSLSLGEKVTSGEQLRVAKGGSLAVSIQDGTLIQMREGTVLDFFPSPRKTGLLNLLAGSLLTVMPVGNRYLIAGPTATIGIKGTVIFREVFDESVTSAKAMGGKTAQLPGKGQKDYFCTCNGAVDYLKKGDLDLIGSEHAEHHNAVFLNPANPKLIERFEMIDHFDRDIKAAIDLQDGPKHDMSFLKL
jgi:FecR protein